jgi:hypothetical protein
VKPTTHDRITVHAVQIAMRYADAREVEEAPARVVRSGQARPGIHRSRVARDDRAGLGREAVTGAERYKAWYQRQRQAGLCVTCSDPSGSAVHCPSCRERHRAEGAERYRMLRDAGLCIRCKAEAAPFRECPTCREQSANRLRRMRAA